MLFGPIILFVLDSTNYGLDGSGKAFPPKTKRIRTTFTEEQVEILQANFNLDSNPDGQDLERIARITGLTKRVTQVSSYTVQGYSCLTSFYNFGPGLCFGIFSGLHNVLNIEIQTVRW